SSPRSRWPRRDPHHRGSIVSGDAAKGGGFDTAHWPLEIRLKTAEKVLEIDFDDGHRFRLPAEYLRVESPSAEVQGHNPSQKQLVHGRAHVGILAVEPAGNYAVRLTFDALHDTGTYTSTYHYKLGAQHE